MKKALLTLLFGAASSATVAAAPASISAMRWQHRVLLVNAPGPQDSQYLLQRRILSDWQHEAADRDVTLVAVTGGTVAGASDTAASLRQRYGLAPDAFQALLIGKDGHVALRSTRPIDAGKLQGTIDAMPMRRSGQR